MKPPRIPGATYRLQFHKDFRLADALGIVDYLHALGITDVYASPLLKARAGSRHGYDVVDHGIVNPEIGTEEDLGRLAEALRAKDMGLILDVVPNHMCISDAGNGWWASVLEHGPSSPYARTFDIDWHPPKEELENRVLLPVLGDQFGRVLERQEIRVEYAEGAFSVRYFENRFPLAPETWTAILEPCLAAMRGRLGEENAHAVELESILSALGHFVPRTETVAEKVRERLREKEVVKRRLDALAKGCGEFREVVEANLRELNGTPGEPRSFDRLDALLSAQGYRLSYWRVAADEINYRRFFDINELAAIRVEDPDVFRAIHERVFDWLGRGWATGLRVDHVDGLFDPAQYLHNLQESASRAADRPVWLVVEKILGRGERLSRDWPIHGTTGYDFLVSLNGLFVDPAAAVPFRDFYRSFAGGRGDVREQLATCKKLIMLVSMASELNVLSRRLDRISEQHRASRDFTRESLRFALREVVASFPVYRTYVRADGAVDPLNREPVEEAILAAKRASPATSPSIFDFVRSTWLLEHVDGTDREHWEERREFVMRLQQFTGPVMAKGCEDTLFYRNFPLVSLNEVGSEPEAFGTTVEDFHRRNQEQAAAWPHTMNATSTHDTKRSEDARARLNALSEIPAAWFEAVKRWREMNRPHHSAVDGREAPDVNEEYLFYQTLVSIWETPTEELRGRVDAYMRKALREAKLRSSWINPNEKYEEAVTKFVGAALDPAGGFLKDFAAFHAPVAKAGMMNSLAQTLIKVAAPGVPDFYQGSEVWDTSLVDPDNRRLVDYARRRELLASLEGEASADMLKRLADEPEDGRLKMHVMRAGLRLRAAQREVFDAATYAPVAAAGPRALHVVAFARHAGARSVIAAAGRFLLKKGDAPWKDTTLSLPPEVESHRFRDALSGRTFEAADRALPLDRLFDILPLALLEALP